MRQRKVRGHCYLIKGRDVHAWGLQIQKIPVLYDRQTGRKVKAGLMEELPGVSAFGTKNECAITLKKLLMCVYRCPQRPVEGI